MEKLRLSFIAAATAFLCLVAGPVSAFNVDGRVTSDDNYTTVYNMDFYVYNTWNGYGGNQRIEGGKLRIGRDGNSGDIYMLLEVPTSITDNVYGAAANTSGSGWNYGHPFSDLKYSDSFEFQIDTGCGGTFIEVDYANSSGQSSIRNSGGGTLTDVATSLEYNLSRGYGDLTNSPDPITGSPAGDWIQAVQYEFRLDGSKFDPGAITLADISWAWLHASPNKLKGNSDIKLKCLYYNNCTEAPNETTDPPPTAMPAPGGGLLFALAAGFLGYTRRRRHAA